MGVLPEQGPTIVHALTANGTLCPEDPAMRHREVGQPATAAWPVVTWAEYLLRVRRIAAGLAELGVEPGGRVAILSANSVEWHLADLGGARERERDRPDLPDELAVADRLFPQPLGRRASASSTATPSSARFSKCATSCLLWSGSSSPMGLAAPGDSFVISFD